MKLRSIILSSVALLGCISCVETDPLLGGSLIPTKDRYMMFSSEIPLDRVEMRMADSLSGFSSTKITIGAVRDEDFGLSTRACAMTLVPMVDTADFGDVQKINYFRITAGLDSVSVAQKGQENILQNVYVYALNEGLDYTSLIDAADEEGLITHGSESIVKGTPVLNGSDSLRLNFTDSYARGMVDWLNGKVLTDSLVFASFIDKFPGIWIGTDIPSGYGGRINTYDLQLGYNSSYYYLEGNYGELSINSIFDEQTGPVDTTFYFYYGGLTQMEVSDFLSDYSTGSFPQYAFNVSTHSTRSLAGEASEKILVEGGAGLKPVIGAEDLVRLAKQAIADSLASSGLAASLLDKAVVNKATIVLPFDLLSDYDALDTDFPVRLSPTCRIVTDTTSSFMGLTDASSSSENQGDVNRSLLEYSPDITYHMQQLLSLDEDDENLQKGNYDIWMLIMRKVTTTTSSSSSSDLSEYYQYLAYQSYYNSMYGGYGYGSGYGSNYYSNYYSYMLAAMYASGSTSTSTTYELDTGNWYDATLCGPANAQRHPTLRIVFSVPEQ